MAIVKVIEINANTSEAKKNLESLNSTIDEQRLILIELEKELIKTEQLQSSTSKTNLAAQKKLTEQSNHLKDAIKDQRLGLRTLNADRRTATASVKELSSEEANQGKIVKLLDTVTGGYATKAIKLYQGFKEGLIAVKGFNLGLNATKKALIATGIGALVVAVGLLVANFDKFKNAISGASSEQKKLAADSEKLVKSSKDNLAATEATENTLKMQGKSEKEILALKIKQTDEIIAATEIQLQQQKDLKKTQIEASQRNQKIAAGIIGFLSLPVTTLLGAVDALTFGLSKIGVLKEATTLAQDFMKGGAKLIGFDPEEVEKEGDATIKETEKQLAALKNTRDGFKIKQQDDAKKDAEKAARIAKEVYDDQKRLLEESLKDESLNFEQRRKLVSDNLKLNATDRKKINDEINKEEKKSIADHKKAIADLNKKLDDETANRLADTAVKKEQLDFDRRILEIEKLTTDINERNALIEKLDSEHKIRMGIAQKADAQKTIQIEKDIADQKKALQNSQLNAISAGIGLLSGLAGKNKALQKAAIIAESAMGIARSIIANTASNVTVAAQGAALAIPSAGASVLAAGKIIVANNIATGIGIAANIAATAKALSSVGGGAAPSAGGVPSGGGGGGATVSQPPAFNVVGASGTNQLADAIGGQSKQPIKAFVVSNDVTSAQSMDRNIVSGASI